MKKQSHVSAHSNSTGFSLVELLVVIIIVIILCAILFPVLSKAKKSALQSQEISQLKNLAVAHSLYVADYDDDEPGSSIPIISAGYAPKSLVSLVLDPFENGWANFSRKGAVEPKTSYKDSFVTLRGSAGKKFFPLFRESTNGGWLISASYNLEQFGGDVIFKPVQYKRLTFSGSVIRRIFPVTTSGDITSIYMDRCFSDDKVIPDTVKK